MTEEADGPDDGPDGPVLDRPVIGEPIFASAIEPVGRDLAAVDWEATPLGEPGSWAPALRTVLGTLVSSRFSMWMAWGPELTFFCNDAYRRDTLGRKYPWALGRPASEVWAEIWEDIGPRIHRVLETGEATWDEGLLLFLERAGFAEETYHTFSYSPLRDDQGAVAGMLCVVTEDTARVVGERRLATLRDMGAEPTALRREEDTWAFAARCLSANRRTFPFALLYRFGEDASATVAATSGMAAGDPWAPSVLLPGDPAPVWPLTAVRAGRTEVVDLEGEAPLPTGDWSEAPRQALVVPVVQPGAEPYGFLVAGLNRYRPLDGGYRAFVDLAAGHVAAGVASARAYEMERRRAEALAELDAAKTAFFTNVSHELRTPLTLIIGPGEEALGDAADPLSPTQRQRMEVVQRNAERLLHLVNALLEFSRLSDGEAQPVLQPTDLAAYTEELASMFRSAVERAGLALVVECGPLRRPVEVDQEMWAKIVGNLLSNALKFTFDGEIRLGLRVEGPEIVLAVADTGVGIDRKDQPRLFQRFQRVAGTRSRSHEGSGIGLALVAELVRLHDGTVEVDSAPGRGSTFTVRLPHRPAAAGAVAAGDRTGSVAAGYARGFLSESARWLGVEMPAAGAPAERPKNGGAGTGSGGGPPEAGSRSGLPRVLVVDDNADMRDHVAAVLGDAYDIELAVDGADAFDRARARPPDLVLTDVMMPNLDGFGLLGALRQDPVLCAVPVVMVSARAGEEPSVEGLEAGADDYLVKPFSARELRARVRANLELDRVRRQRAELEHSHNLLDQAERLARVGSWEVDLSDGSVRVSDQFLQIAGVGREAMDALGLVGALEALVHPDERDRVARLVDGAASGAPLDFETTVARPDGSPRRVVVTGELATGADGRGRLRGAVQDVTERRATEQALAERSRELLLLAAQLDALAAVLAGRPLADALDDLLLAIEGASSDGLMASVLLADADGEHLRHGAAPSLDPDYNRAIDGIEVGPAVGSCGTAAHRRAQVVTEDIETDPNWEPYRPLAMAAGLRACWSTPVLARDGRLLGTFAMHYPRPQRPSEAELALARVLGRTVALVVERAQFDEAREQELAAERAAAVTLQHSLLPVIPQDIGAVRLACSYHTGDPGVEVGGDWYDAFDIPDGVVLMIGDVQGHDLRAATVMGQLRTLARDYVTGGMAPAEILARLDRYLCDLGTDLLATVAVVQLSVATATVTAASAGHVPPLVFEPDPDGVRTRELETVHGPPLGLGGPWTERQSPIVPGSTVLLYTDGLVESRRIGIDEGIGALHSVLRSLPADVNASALLSAVLDLVPEGSRRDDVAVLAATLPSAQPG